MHSIAENLLIERLGAVSDIKGGPVRQGSVIACSGNSAQVEGIDLSIGSGVKIVPANNQLFLGEVSKIYQEKTTLTLFDNKAAISVGDKVESFTGLNAVAVGSALLGRVIDPMGHPIDGAGKIDTDDHWPLDGHPVNALNRSSITQPFDVGVRAINALLPVGEGQRLALIAGSGVGKSVLIRQCSLNAKADVTVLGLVGERAREISDFIAESSRRGRSEKLVTVAVPADHSPLLRIKAAQRATAIAEYFRDQGKSVLLIIDSLTRVAHAQREIGLALGEPPTMKGYPPSTFSIIPKLLERAGNDVRTGGSITALYTVLADGDDINDPVVDAARAITDGHIQLDRSLAEQGVYPAIDVGRSISRVANDITAPEHQNAMRNFRSLWSSYQQNRDLIMMGAYHAGSDPVMDEAINRRPEQLAFLSQLPDSSVNLNNSVDQLMEGFSQ